MEKAITMGLPQSAYHHSTGAYLALCIKSLPLPPRLLFPDLLLHSCQVCLKLLLPVSALCLLHTTELTFQATIYSGVNHISTCRLQKAQPAPCCQVLTQMQQSMPRLISSFHNHAAFGNASIDN